MPERLANSLKERPTELGLMAQDVAKKKPEAVAVTPSGYLAVDYSKATGLMGAG